MKALKASLILLFLVFIPKQVSADPNLEVALFSIVSIFTAVPALIGFILGLINLKRNTEKSQKLAFIALIINSFLILPAYSILIGSYIHSNWFNQFPILLTALSAIFYFLRFSDKNYYAKHWFAYSYLFVSSLMIITILLNTTVYNFFGYAAGKWISPIIYILVLFNCIHLYFFRLSRNKNIKIGKVLSKALLFSILPALMQVFSIWSMSNIAIVQFSLVTEITRVLKVPIYALIASVISYIYLNRNLILKNSNQE